MPVVTMQVDTVMTHINTLYFQSDFQSLQNKFFYYSLILLYNLSSVNIKITPYKL